MFKIAPLLLLCALLFTGCASVSIKDVEKTPSLVSHTPPKRFYVMDFKTDDAEFRVDRTGKELKKFKDETARRLSKALIYRLEKRFGNAEHLESGKKLPSSGWLIAGSYTRVNQGSRALRATIGFGAGGTKMETETEVFDLAVSATEPFLRFDTTGGSNAEPGILINAMDPISLVGTGAGALGGASKGITEDTKRTARMIIAELSQHMYQQGWIDKSKLMNPKWKGKLSPIVPK